MSERSAEDAVLSQLGELDIEFEVLECDPEFADTAAFCERHEVSLSQAANAILVKSRRGEPRFGLTVVAANCKLKNRTMRQLLETSKASFASAEETREITGMMIGGVSVFGLPPDLPIWIDARVMTAPMVVIGGGSRSIKIQLSPKELTKLPRARVVDELASLVQPRTT